MCFVPRTPRNCDSGSGSGVSGPCDGAGGFLTGSPFPRATGKIKITSELINSNELFSISTSPVFQIS